VRVEDRIDPAVGFLAEVKIGDELKADDLLGLLYCRSEEQAREATGRIRDAYKIGDDPPPTLKLIKEVITQ
jgi:thymidine phosphorylase